LKQPLSNNTARGAAVKLEAATQANTARGAAVKLEADTSSKQTTNKQAQQLIIKQKQTNLNPFLFQ
jgi:hypothetical protein